MNHTIEGSEGYVIDFIAFGKPLEKGIDVKESGEKDSFILDAMEIKVGNCRASDMGLSKSQIEQLMKNRKSRKTARTVSKTKTTSQR